MSFIIALKDVLVGDISKNRYRLLENCLRFEIGSLLKVRVSSTSEIFRLTPLRLFRKLSSMKSEMYSGALGFRLMKDSKAYAYGMSDKKG